MSIHPAQGLLRHLLADRHDVVGKVEHKLVRLRA